jgi:hypothetical protein
MNNERKIVIKRSKSYTECMITAVWDVIFTFSSIQPSALLKSWKQHNPLHPVSEIILAPLNNFKFYKVYKFAWVNGPLTMHID